MAIAWGGRIPGVFPSNCAPLAVLTRLVVGCTTISCPLCYVLTIFSIHISITRPYDTLCTKSIFWGDWQVAWMMHMNSYILSALLSLVPRHEQVWPGNESQFKPAALLRHVCIYITAHSSHFSMAIYIHAGRTPFLH